MKKKYILTKMRLRKAALEVIEQERVIKLNTKDSLSFAEALLAPPKAPTTEFAKAWQLYKENVKQA